MSQTNFNPRKDNQQQQQQQQKDTNIALFSIVHTIDFISKRALPK